MDRHRDYSAGKGNCRARIRDGKFWHNYVYLRGVRKENRELKEEIQQLRLTEVRISEDAQQAHRLQVLLGFKEQYLSKTVAAQVIGSGGSDRSRVVFIDKGDDANLRADMPVITADGIVGKVVRGIRAQCAGAAHQ